MTAPRDAKVPVTEREYLELLVQKETAVIMEKLAAMDKEHTVQATELARRLDELNHSHAQAVMDKEKLASVESLEAVRERVERLERTASGRESLPAEGRETRRLVEVLAGRVEKLERIPWAFGIVFLVVQIGVAVGTAVWVR